MEEEARWLSVGLGLPEVSSWRNHTGTPVNRVPFLCTQRLSGCELEMGSVGSDDWTLGPQLGKLWNP